MDLGNKLLCSFATARAVTCTKLTLKVRKEQSKEETPEPFDQQ